MSYESFGWRSAEKKAVDDGSSVRRTRNQCHRRQCTGRLGLRLKKTHRLDYCHHVASYRSHSMFQGSGVTLRKGAGVGDEWPNERKDHGVDERLCCAEDRRCRIQHSLRLRVRGTALPLWSNGRIVKLLLFFWQGHSSPTPAPLRNVTPLPWNME